MRTQVDVLLSPEEFFFCCNDNIRPKECSKISLGFFFTTRGVQIPDLLPRERFNLFFVGIEPKLGGSAPKKFGKHIFIMKIVRSKKGKVCG